MRDLTLNQESAPSKAKRKLEYELIFRFIYGLEGMKAEERKNVISAHPRIMGYHNINRMKSPPIVRKEYRKHGIQPIMHAYGKWWRRLLERPHPCEQRRQERKEAER